MPYITEELNQLDLTDKEVELLETHGFIIKSEEFENMYETTALIWNDLNLSGEKALKFIEAALAGWY